MERQEVGLGEFNPWLSVSTPEVLTSEKTSEPNQELPQATGPQGPQKGVPVPQGNGRLPSRPISRAAPLWWLGVHGGAGETSLAALLGSSRAAEHAWPTPVTLGLPDSSPEGDAFHHAAPGVARVVLVARTHASGLRAAQIAATEWASGAVQGVDLLGLALVADAPGKLPRSLRDTAKVVTGGVPRVWKIPWIEAWRLGEPISVESSPRLVRAMVTDLNALLSV